MPANRLAPPDPIPPGAGRPRTPPGADPTSKTAQRRPAPSRPNPASATGAASGSRAIAAQSSSSARSSSSAIVQSAAASLQASPATVAFGNVLAGVNNSQPLYLINSGSSDLTVTQIAASGPGFGVSGFSLPLTLTAGQSAYFAIDFDSTQSGAASGNAL